MAKEIKRCPFCGGAAQLSRHTNGGSTIGCTGLLDSCYFVIPITFDSISKAIKAWNTRA